MLHVFGYTSVTALVQQVVDSPVLLLRGLQPSSPGRHQPRILVDLYRYVKRALGTGSPPAHGPTTDG